MYLRRLSRKVAQLSTVSVLYALTVLFVVYAVHPGSFGDGGRKIAIARAMQHPAVPPAKKVKLVAGRPVRIVIADSGIDLPVDEGYYDSATDAWTLSGYHAQFAMLSTLANNLGGDTFIYGHNNNYVFGALRHNTPAAGAPATIYTDNGHIFSYKFDAASSLSPDDTSVLKYNGPPQLTIQTCTGGVNEWRTMYRFAFDRVVQ